MAATHSIPIHLVPKGDPNVHSQLFGRERAEAFQVEEHVIIEPGEEIEL